VLATEFLELMNIEVSELAEAMGVRRNTLSRIVHDKRALPTPMAAKLAAAQDLLRSTAIWFARKSQTDTPLPCSLSRVFGTFALALAGQHPSSHTR